jgi:hypothetical protein
MACSTACTTRSQRDRWNLKLDDAGNKLVTSALKTTRKTDHLRATVTGDLKGDTIKVTSLSLDGAAQ